MKTIARKNTILKAIHASNNRILYHGDKPRISPDKPRVAILEGVLASGKVDQSIIEKYKE